VNPAAVREVIEAAEDAIAKSESGFDEDVLAAVSRALAPHVPFKRMVVSIEEDGGRAFRIFWRSGQRDLVDEKMPSGVTVQFDPAVEGLPPRPHVPQPIIIEDLTKLLGPMHRAVQSEGANSYVCVPVVNAAGLAWLTITSAHIGPPTPGLLELLLELAKTLAPAIARACRIERAYMLSSVVEASSDGILCLEKARVVRQANASALSLLGKNHADVVGQRIETVLGDTVGRAIAALPPAPADGPVPLTVVPVTSMEREGLEVSVGRVRGSIEAEYQVHLRDERARRAVEAELRNLLDHLPVIVARIDLATGQTPFVNGAAVGILGVSAADVTERGIESFLVDDDERAASALARARLASAVAAGLHREGGPPSGERWHDRRYAHADGRILTLRQRLHVPAGAGAAAPHEVRLIAYDVSNEIETRSRWLRDAGVAAMGTLAAGMAHEINNPAAFLALAASQVERAVEVLGKDATGARVEATVQARTLAREMIEAARRITQIIGELKLFARTQDGLSATPVDVNRLVEMALTLTSAEIRRCARVEVSLGELPLVPGPYACVAHAFVQILLNAAQAIDAKGLAGAHVVRVETALEPASGSARAIVVRVTDTGVGIPANEVTKVFDPFYTTRASGGAVGLGLTIAEDRVKRVGGDLRVTSRPGEWTRFEIVLPLSTVEDRPSATTRTFALDSTPAVGPHLIPARPRVLVIDDEIPLAKALARQLATRYDVDTASTAADALEQLGRHRYDAVVCDLRMPDQHGPAIFEAVMARSSAQARRFIFTTGGSYSPGDDAIHARARATGRPILEKPFDGASFEDAVARVADQPVAS
jgi:signal transduction histidine kinase/ActR/RegA family two-component response regulator